MRVRKSSSITSQIYHQGFSLIELLMVVAIIATLAVIAIPALNSYRSRANNSAAITDLKNFKVVIEAYYNDSQAYPNL